jgi:hypothetical protein
VVLTCLRTHSKSQRVMASQDSPVGVVCKSTVVLGGSGGLVYRVGRESAMVVHGPEPSDIKINVATYLVAGFNDWFMKKHP